MKTNLPGIVLAVTTSVLMGLSAGAQEMMEMTPDKAAEPPAMEAASGAAAGTAGPQSAPTAEQLAFFESKIRPALAGHCYRCHSAADGKSKGGLTLDTRAGWQKGGETGPALKPGDPGASLLIRAIRHTDPDTAMPPQDGKLPDAVIADFEAWVKMGAPDPRETASAAAAAGGPMTEAMKVKVASHWSFQPLREPEPPRDLRDAAWPANPVDQFVLAKLEEKGLAPSPAADRRTLIRRAFLDLTGLPPTPEEVLAFVRDESPDAFAKVVEDLLARPQYGERWGRHWLDVARYADTRGQTRQRQTPLNPNAWTYRDYVIAAFNADKPFDRFIREQLAADLLPGAGRDGGDGALAALGFLTQGDQFAGNRQDIINDQIDVVTKGFLGLTVTCARCHDHTFDPVPQADYYSLHGIFNSSMEPDEKPQVAAAAMQASTADYETRRAGIVRKGRVQLSAELDRTASQFNRNAQFFVGLSGMKPDSAEYYEYLREHRLDGRLIRELGRLMRQRSMGRTGGPPQPVLAPLRRLMEMKEKNFGKEFPAWRSALMGEKGRLRGNEAVRAVFRGAEPKSKGEALELYASVFLKAEEAWTRESAAWKEKGAEGFFPGLEDPALEEVRTAVADPAMFRTAPLEAAVRGLPREVQFLLNGIQAELARLDVSHAGAPGLANVLYDEPRPRDSRVFLRGQVQNPGPVVPRQFLELLSGPDRKPFTRGSGRLELAEAIASPANPLTARVLVNRVWLHHFGEGFVPTPDDLGVMSGTPSHPELLDWLAARFVKEGWSLKKLHRTILLSRTWQQSSAPDAAKAETDPFNRLLWRQNLRRLDFEAMRDSILFMGGELDLTMGGHPVNIESEPYSQRRSIYGFIDRNAMAEFMRHFDVANAALPTGRRFQTIVPQQALFRMNSLLVIEQARNIIQRPDVQECGTDEERLKKLYEIIYQRWPKPDETRLALAYLDSQGTVAPDPAVSTPAENGRRAPDLSRMSREKRPAYRQEQARREKEKRKKEQAEARRRETSIKEAVRDPSAEKVDRSPLSPWEKYAHALLMTAEMSYVN